MYKYNYKRVFVFLIGMMSTLFSFSQTWSPVGYGFNKTVFTIGSFNNELYAGGWFDSSGTTQIQGIASLNGGSWNSVDLGIYGTPYFTTIFNNELIVGGDFYYVNGILNTKNIARWNGSQWLSAGASNNDMGTIKALASYNGKLYAGGTITKIGNVNVNRIARWNGTNWSSIYSGITGGAEVTCMAVYNGKLYIGGNFWEVDGKTIYGIASWNGSVWDSVGCAGFNNLINTMVVDTVRNVLYVGGPFTNLLTSTNILQPLKYIACWNDTSWSQVGNPTDYISVYNMEIYHGNLYYVGNSPIDTAKIAYWNGISWIRIYGPNNIVQDIEVFNDTLYVGGDFTAPGNHIAKYYSPLTTISEKKSNEPEYLFNNVPNPFNQTTTIPYFMPPGSNGTLLIMDLTGKTIKSYKLSEGKNQQEISLENFGNGMYFYTLSIDNGRIVRHKKMVMIR